MTDTVRPATSAANGPLSGHRILTTRLIRSIGYDIALVPVSLLTIGRTLLGQDDAVHSTWRRLARFQGSPQLPPGSPQLLAASSELDLGRSRRVQLVRALGTWVLSLGLGLLSWFLVMMLVTAVVRGPFYGFVESGPYGPGTWGGPTKAGAWAVHAAVSVPIVGALLFVLRGIGLLQAAVVRSLYGAVTSRWVLPATILSAAGGALLFYSWTQQLSATP